MSFSINHLRLAFTAICSTLSWAFGGFDMLFTALLFLMVFDYFSGLLVAIHKRELSSIKGFKGISKKLMILTIVAVSNIIDVAIIGSGNMCRTIAIAFYSANETISILENASILGLPLPKKLKAILEQFKNG